jgi:hypothetical protein
MILMTPQQKQPTRNDLRFFRDKQVQEFFPVYNVDRVGRATAEIIGRIIPSGHSGEFLFFRDDSDADMANGIICFDHVVSRPAKASRETAAKPFC